MQYRPEVSQSASLAGTANQTLAAPQPSEYGSAYNKCISALVSACAAVTPNAAALVAGKDVLTYGELDAWSNEVARQLRSIGVGPEVLVGVCLPRSTEWAVGALSVLKAGGAYVPLDAEYPPDRIAWMLNDAQPFAVLTTNFLSERIPGGKWRTLELRSHEPGIASHASPALESRVDPENLAYVIYTSGSTGRPKGVAITHGSLLNLVFWHQTAFQVKPSDRASQLASPGFDAAVWELWPYLSIGASVHFADDEIRATPEALRDWLVSNAINIAFVPTPVAERILRLEWPTETALRLLLTGADTLRDYPPPSLPFTLINNYGPTECTVVTTSGPVHSNGNRNTIPPIGRPISNVQVYILDEQLRPVPVGVVGEMYIGGAGVGRGYLNAPELTAAKFVANPFVRPLNERLYRTGDLACYLPDGQIAFRGRIDDQIKIRGNRVEPNEIIAMLAKHPALHATAVVARENTAGDKQLVAYVVPKPGNIVTATLLREFLSGQLPEYMIPAVFVRMESLPVNANGKVNRAALPAPEVSNLLEDETYIEPRTPVERRLAEIVAPLLDLEKISVEDNFFMLGGHSLLGTQLIGRVRERFGVELSLRSLFEAPSVAALAEEVERLLCSRLEEMSQEEQSAF